MPRSSQNNSPLRIGVDAFNLRADRRGMGRIVRTILADLRSRRDIEIVFVAKHGAQLSDLREEFGEPAILPAGLRGSKFDAVWYPWNGMRFRPYAPALVTIHDLFAFTYAHKNFIARRREQAPIRHAIARANVLITVSHWTGDELRRMFHVPADRIAVAPPPLDPFWRPVEPKEVSVKPYVLFVGGPDERKNAATLFAAFERVSGREPNLELVVAGNLSPSDENRFEALRAGKSRVRPDDDRLRELYSGALAVAVPSLAEGFGIPVVEAMACGAPVLASDASALPETAGGAALLLAPRDEGAWADALLRVAMDPHLRAQLREAGFARVRRLDPDGAATALIESARRFRESG